MDTINKSSLLVLHNYNDHANSLVLETAAKLDEQAFTTTSSPSHGSVQGLLTHMLTTEFFFLARSEGKPILPKSPAAALSLEEIRLTFAQVAAERRKYLDWVSEELLAQEILVPIGGQEFQLARWQLLAQSLMHTAHHRGELSIVLTGLGFPLPTLDIIIEFVNESGQHWPWR
jgi:uncharacterized damage-inducible protein DinB